MLSRIVPGGDKRVKRSFWSRKKRRPLENGFGGGGGTRSKKRPDVGSCFGIRILPSGMADLEEGKD
jgi:hypothetical protein